MTDKFEIGEVAIYVRPGSPFYGAEVKILSGLIFQNRVQDHLTGEYRDGGWRYFIDIPTGNPNGFTADPEWLRKKKPPRREIDEVTTWDKCLWKPREVEHA